MSTPPLELSRGTSGDDGTDERLGVSAPVTPANDDDESHSPVASAAVAAIMQQHHQQQQQYPRRQSPPHLLSDSDDAASPEPVSSTSAPSAMPAITITAPTPTSTTAAGSAKNNTGAAISHSPRTTAVSPHVPHQHHLSVDTSDTPAHRTTPQQSQQSHHLHVSTATPTPHQLMHHQQKMHHHASLAASPSPTPSPLPPPAPLFLDTFSGCPRIADYFLVLGRVNDREAPLVPMRKLSRSNSQTIQPISDVVVVLSDKLKDVPPEFTRLTDFQLHDVDVNPGLLRTPVYLAESRVPRRRGSSIIMPITGLDVVYVDRKEVPRPGFTQLPGNLSARSLRSNIAVCIERDTAKSPLIDIKVVCVPGGNKALDAATKWYATQAAQHSQPPQHDPSKPLPIPSHIHDPFAALVPPEYSRVDRSVNIGKDLFLVYKTAKRRAVEYMSYEPFLVDRYPETDRPDFPLETQGVSMLCFPRGMLLKTENQLPTFMTFVLTQASGREVYGAALIFYEEMQVDIQNTPGNMATQQNDGGGGGGGGADGSAYSTRHSSHEDATIGTSGGGGGGNANGSPGLHSTTHNSSTISTGGNMTSSSHTTGGTASSMLPPAPSASQTTYCPRCLCLLSHYPFYELFRTFLNQLYRIAVSPSNMPLERFIGHFFNEVPVPRTYIPNVNYTIGHARVTLSLPPACGLSYKNYSLITLFRCMSVPNIVAIFEHILSEGKLVFYSHSHSILTPVAETIRCLLFPMKWQCVFIPILPTNLAYTVRAPVPFIIGLHRSFLDELKVPDDVFLVDLDRNIIRLPNNIYKPSTQSSVPSTPHQHHPLSSSSSFSDLLSSVAASATGSSSSGTSAPSSAHYLGSDTGSNIFGSGGSSRDLFSSPQQQQRRSGGGGGSSHHHHNSNEDTSKMLYPLPEYLKDFLTLELMDVTTLPSSNEPSTTTNGKSSSRDTDDSRTRHLYQPQDFSAAHHQHTSSEDSHSNNSFFFPSNLDLDIGLDMDAAQIEAIEIKIRLAFLKVTIAFLGVYRKFMLLQAEESDTFFDLDRLFDRRGFSKHFQSGGDESLYHFARQLSDTQIFSEFILNRVTPSKAWQEYIFFDYLVALQKDDGQMYGGRDSGGGMNGGATTNSSNNPSSPLPPSSSGFNNNYNNHGSHLITPTHHQLLLHHHAESDVAHVLKEQQKADKLKAILKKKIHSSSLLQITIHSLSDLLKSGCLTSATLEAIRNLPPSLVPMPRNWMHLHYDVPPPDTSYLPEGRGPYEYDTFPSLDSMRFGEYAADEPQKEIEAGLNKVNSPNAPLKWLMLPHPAHTQTPASVHARSTNPTSATAAALMQASTASSSPPQHTETLSTRPSHTRGGMSVNTATPGGALSSRRNTELDALDHALISHETSRNRLTISLYTHINSLSERMRTWSGYDKTTIPHVQILYELWFSMYVASCESERHRKRRMRRKRIQDGTYYPLTFLSPTGGGSISLCTPRHFDQATSEAALRAEEHRECLSDLLNLFVELHTMVSRGNILPSERMLEDLSLFCLRMNLVKEFQEIYRLFSTSVPLLSTRLFSQLIRVGITTQLINPTDQLWQQGTADGHIFMDGETVTVSQGGASVEDVSDDTENTDAATPAPLLAAGMTTFDAGSGSTSPLSPSSSDDTNTYSYPRSISTYAQCIKCLYELSGEEIYAGWMQHHSRLGSSCPICDTQVTPQLVVQSTRAHVQTVHVDLMKPSSIRNTLHALATLHHASTGLTTTSTQNTTTTTAHDISSSDYISVVRSSPELFWNLFWYFVTRGRTSGGAGRGSLPFHFLFNEESELLGRVVPHYTIDVSPYKPWKVQAESQHFSRDRERTEREKESAAAGGHNTQGSISSPFTPGGSNFSLLNAPGSGSGGNGTHRDRGVSWALGAEAAAARYASSSALTTSEPDESGKLSEHASTSPSSDDEDVTTPPQSQSTLNLRAAVDAPDTRQHRAPSVTTILHSLLDGSVTTESEGILPLSPRLSSRHATITEDGEGGSVSLAAPLTGSRPGSRRTSTTLLDSSDNTTARESLSSSGGNGEPRFSTSSNAPGSTNSGSGSVSEHHSRRRSSLSYSNIQYIMSHVKSRPLLQAVRTILRARKERRLWSLEERQEDEHFFRTSMYSTLAQLMPEGSLINDPLAYVNEYKQALASLDATIETHKKQLETLDSVHLLGGLGIGPVPVPYHSSHSHTHTPSTAGTQHGYHPVGSAPPTHHHSATSLAASGSFSSSNLSHSPLPAFAFAQQHSQQSHSNSTSPSPLTIGEGVNSGTSSSAILSTEHSAVFELRRKKKEQTMYALDEAIAMKAEVLPCDAPPLTASVTMLQSVRKMFGCELHRAGGGGGKDRGQRTSPNYSNTSSIIDDLFIHDVPSLEDILTQTSQNPHYTLQNFMHFAESFRTPYEMNVLGLPQKQLMTMSSNSVTGGITRSPLHVTTPAHGPMESPAPVCSTALSYVRFWNAVRRWRVRYERNDRHRSLSIVIKNPHLITGTDGGAHRDSLSSSQQHQIYDGVFESARSIYDRFMVTREELEASGTMLPPSALASSGITMLPPLDRRASTGLHSIAEVTSPTNAEKESQQPSEPQPEDLPPSSPSMAHLPRLKIDSTYTPPAFSLPPPSTTSSSSSNPSSSAATPTSQGGHVTTIRGIVLPRPLHEQIRRTLSQKSTVVETIDPLLGTKVSNLVYHSVPKQLFDDISQVVLNWLKKHVYPSYCQEVHEMEEEEERRVKQAEEERRKKEAEKRKEELEEARADEARKAAVVQEMLNPHPPHHQRNTSQTDRPPLPPRPSPSASVMTAPIPTATPVTLPSAAMTPASSGQQQLTDDRSGSVDANDPIPPPINRAIRRPSVPSRSTTGTSIGTNVAASSSSTGSQPATPNLRTTPASSMPNTPAASPSTLPRATTPSLAPSGSFGLDALSGMVAPPPLLHNLSNESMSLAKSGSPVHVPDFSSASPESIKEQQQ